MLAVLRHCHVPVMRHKGVVGAGRRGSECSQAWSSRRWRKHHALSFCVLQGMTELDAPGMATIKSLKRLRVLTLSELQLEPADADAVRAALPNLADFSYEQVSADEQL